VQGGSTITQQLVKNLYLSADRTPLRKLREAAIALVLESALRQAGRFSRPTSNEVYLGQDGTRSIHGVGAAARYYFRKDVRKIFGRRVGAARRDEFRPRTGSPRFVTNGRPGIGAISCSA